ncbi:uncharacterized protein LOC111014362 [Momordica charantia]|uniref:Uncharacterized protein LOC111014362 n=1 Tax=Momordica charantia TaxID=3673 RepID=A0A6J1CUK2_MOMCH|nr:uncharacterized protein LOC111014362 [Momordica charantia]
MASPGGDGGVSDAAGSPFPAADVDRELNPGHNRHVEVDPVSSEVAVSLEKKEQAKRKAVEEERKEAKKNDTMKTLKTTFIVSGVIAAVAVAAFAIVKKLREN